MRWLLLSYFQVLLGDLDQFELPLERFPDLTCCLVVRVGLIGVVGERSGVVADGVGAVRLVETCSSRDGDRLGVADN